MKWSLLVLLILLPPDLSAGTELSIDEAIRTGLSKNRSLQIATLAADAEWARASEADAQMLPSLSVSGSYNRLSDGAFRLSTTNLPQPIQVGNVVVDNFAVQVGVRQPLFTGFRLSSLSDAAELTAHAARGDQRMTEQDVIYAVTAAYWSLYQARKMTELSSGNVRRLEQYRQDAERLGRAGLATRNDILQIEVQLGRARITLLEAETGARVAEMRLNTTIGLPAATPVTLTSHPGNGDGAAVASTGPVEALVDSALGRRPDVLAAGLRLLAAEEMVNAASGSWWPQLEFSAHYNYSNPNQRYQPITPEFLGSWDVGITMLFEIWNWGKTGSQVEQAEAMQKSSALRKTQLAESIILEVHTSLFSFEQSLQKIEVSALAVEAARENLRGISEKYASGLATSSEIIDAEIDLFSSEVEFSAARVEYELSVAELKRAVGEHPEIAEIR
ncbi:MAG: TolC family protein [Ignavibacteria bacterium]|nr:TolC family protein [Ignavibacteria bacterium]